MIGSGLKKLASRHDMKVSKGVAYGSMYGYAATLSEGNGWKLISITTTFPNFEKSREFQAALNAKDLKKEYRITNLLITQDSIHITFLDNPGTMKKIEAFVEYFFPLLKEFDASPYQICTQCNCEITSGSWKLIEGTAYFLHDSCADKLKREIAEEEELKKQEDSGSYITGTIGALLGSVLGAILWAIILSLGYLASIVGFVIGWCAEKGYTLFRGKNGKGKLVILIIAVLFGVFLGTVGGETLTVISWILKGELPGYTLADIPLLMIYMFVDPEVLTGIGLNVLLGIVFAILGIFSLLRKTNKEVSLHEIF